MLLIVDEKTPDWERIEADYRAGVLSNREIAAKAGNVTEAAIRKRAKRDGWTKDLQARIKAKADDLVRREAVRTAGAQLATANPKAEREIVDANAMAIATVRLEHRTDIGRARRLLAAMLTELEAQTGEPVTVERLQELVALADNPEADPKAIESMRQALRKVVSLPSRIGAMKTLSDALKSVVNLEREAWGLQVDGGPPDVDPVRQQLPPDAVEAARVYQKLMAGG